MWFKLAWREINNNRRFSLFFILNLSWGLFGFVALDAFKESLQAHVSLHSKDLLGADLNVSARRELSIPELKILHDLIPRAQESKALEFFSMLSSSKQSHLVDVNVIEKNFPFYGHLTLTNQGEVRGKTNRDIDFYRNVWVYPELLLQLGLQIGDKVKIGDEEFRISDTVRDDSANSWIGTSISPAVYIGFPSLKSSALLGRGSVITHDIYFKLPPETDADEVMNKIDRQLTDPGIQVSSHRSAGKQTAKGLRYLNDYLGLVALVALFLAGIGASYLFRGFLNSKVKDMAILRSLGLSPLRAISIYLLQVALLGVMAFIPVIILSASILPSLKNVLKMISPFDFNIFLGAQSVFIALIMSIFGSVLICLPFVVKIKDLKPSLLFGGLTSDGKQNHLSFFIWFLPAFLAFWTLSVLQSHSLIVGSLFYAGLMVSLLFFALIGRLLLKLIEPGLRSSVFAVKNISRNLIRNPMSSLSCFMALSLGCLLLNLIPQLENSLIAELETDPSRLIPSLFLFDIQAEQIEDLKKFIVKKGQKLEGISPLIRARITEVNGLPFTKDLGERKNKTREEEQDQRFRNRGINLTYKEKMGPSESIIKGEPLSGRFTGAPFAVPEISIEHKYAERLGLNLGDQLKFDIQGVETRGVVKNLRRVRWSSFEPNFFIEFQQGVLEDAPKTYLADIPTLSEQIKSEIQNETAVRFPNISMIDVTRLVAKIREISLQMSWALKFMAFLSFVSSLTVLFSISNYQAHERRNSTNLLKVLGTPLLLIQQMMFFEFAFLGGLSCIFGAVLSVVMSYLLSLKFFDSSWVINWNFPLLSVGAVALLSGISALLSSRNILSASAVDLLQEESAN